MAKKPHVKLNSARQNEKTVKMSFNYGFGEEDEKKIENPNYIPMVDTFRRSIDQLNIDQETRRLERNELLQIPSHIEYIQIWFQDQFDIKNFYNSWLTDFGLLGIKFSHFNRQVLFAIEDVEKFEVFLNNIKNFILKESGENDTVDYLGKIKFIKEFKLLTTEDILNIDKEAELLKIKLMDFPLKVEGAETIYKSLETYLNEKNYNFRLMDESRDLEVYNASMESIVEIAQNFDIVLNITSSLSTLVSPSEFNITERGYGFEISNSQDDLPLIGILDTGISNTSPLVSILIDDNSFNLTQSSPFIDNANDGLGHGTSVAALAALGRKPYQVNYTGRISADAKLLSMKILDGSEGMLSMYDVLQLLYKAKADYPEIKIFVLTTCYSSFKSTNEDYSSYAYYLDKFSHENDCLIFICTANNDDAVNQPGYDIRYFNEEETNLRIPAESMNNIIVGAAADNLNNGVFNGISYGREFPTLYSRKSHIDLELYKDPNKTFIKNNPHLFKPDVIDCAGDYEESNGLIGFGEQATLEVLSADQTRSFIKTAGTSYSTPLVSNIAAQIQRSYPMIRTQTIKALILNSASLSLIRFDDSVIKLKNKTAGHGIVNSEVSVNSSDNSITFVVEDSISPNEMMVIPLNLPEYLLNEDLGKRNGILKITSTLCFSFEPVINNHLSYCPIQMAFAIFRNHSGDEILLKEGELQSKLKRSWSQNNRWKSKPIPASNSQKVQFLINIKDLEDEESTFKLAIHCLLNEQIFEIEKYNTQHQFSMAITIEENLPTARQTGKLYNEMIAINETENIIEIEGEAEVEGEV